MLMFIFLAVCVHSVVSEVTFNTDGVINLRKTLPPTVIRLNLRDNQENEINQGKDKEQKSQEGKEEIKENPETHDKGSQGKLKTEEELDSQEKTLEKQKAEDEQVSQEKSKTKEEQGSSENKDEKQLNKNADKYFVEKNNYAQESIGLIWPLGIIPYYVDYQSYDYILGRRIRESMDMIESASCVRFKPVLIPPTSKHFWLHFTNKDRVRKCIHETKSINRNDSKEETEVTVVIGLDCLKRRDVLHALLHAIGLNDEVTHPQRDQYVRIMWEKIHPEYRYLFRKQIQEDDTQTFVEYDPLSIMHFHDRAFSRNGQATIAPLVPGLQIDPSDKLSHLDKLKLRVLFSHECNRRKVDDLMDTCKMVLHGENDNNGGDNNSGSNKENNNRGDNNSGSEKLNKKEDYNNPGTDDEYKSGDEENSVIHNGSVDSGKGDEANENKEEGVVDEE